MRIGRTIVTGFLCMAALAAVCGADEFPPERVARVTDGLRKFRQTWTKEETVALLRLGQSDTGASIPIQADDGRKLAVDVRWEQQVFVNGQPLDGASAGRASGANAVLLMAAIGLSLAFFLSLVVNLHLFWERKGRSSSRRTDVLRSVSRL